jgi:hypothetical protein
MPALVSLPSRGSGSVAYETPGLPDAWWALREPPSLPDGPLTFVDRPDRGMAGLRRKKPPPRVLPTVDHLHQLVVDRAGAKALAGVEGVTLRPAPLRDDRGGFAEYVLVEVAARVPLDRREATAKLSRGWLVTVERAAWRVPPRPRIFRLLDRPTYLYIDRALGEALGVALDAHDARLDQGGFPPPWSLAGSVPELRDDPGAEAAFWELYAGKAAARARALAHPWWAFAVAACVDGEASGDTRAAASRSPITAARYAIEIDRGPHPATRRGALTSGLSALQYATHVDLAVDPRSRPKILADAGHDEGTLAEEERRLAALAAWLRGEAPAPPMPRAFPAHRRPRWARGKDALDDAVRSDVEAFVPRGYQRLGVADDAAIDHVVARAHAALDELRAKKPRGKARTVARMELGCAWGEQLHRALGWQWARLGQGVALVSPDRALAHDPFAFVGAVLGGERNTLQLLFNMLADGQTPPAKARSYTSIA